MITYIYICIVCVVLFLFDFSPKKRVFDCFRGPDMERHCDGGVVWRCDAFSVGGGLTVVAGSGTPT